MLLNSFGLVSLPFLLIGASIAFQWPYPNCCCYKHPGSDKIRGRTCSQYAANWTLTVIWLILAAMSAVNKNVSRVALCSVYMVAHGVVVTFMRCKFRRDGAPAADDNENNILSLEFRTTNVELPDSRANSQEGFSSVSHADRIPLAANSPLDATRNVIGLPVYNLPMYYAVVGCCPSGCTCPYCHASADRHGITELSSSIFDRSNCSHPMARGTATWSSQLQSYADYTVDLQLPGALMPEAAVSGFQGEMGSRLVQVTSSSQFAARIMLLDAPRSNRLHSAAGGSRSDIRRRRQQQRPLALPVLGVPVPRDSSLVEGVPSVDLMRWRRSQQQQQGQNLASATEQ